MASATWLCPMPPYFLGTRCRVAASHILQLNSIIESTDDIVASMDQERRLIVGNSATSFVSSARCVWSTFTATRFWMRACSAR